MPSDDLKKAIDEFEKKPEGDSGEVLITESGKEVEGESIETKEKQTVSDDVQEQHVRQELEKIQSDEAFKNRAPVSVSSQQTSVDDQKVAHLLEVARKKGAVVAVKVAQKMNNPYVLDILHDKLIEEGYKP